DPLGDSHEDAGIRLGILAPEHDANLAVTEPLFFKDQQSKPFGIALRPHRVAVNDKPTPPNVDPTFRYVPARDQRQWARVRLCYWFITQQRRGVCRECQEPDPKQTGNDDCFHFVEMFLALHLSDTRFISDFGRQGLWRPSFSVSKLPGGPKTSPRRRRRSSAIGHPRSSIWQGNSRFPPGPHPSLQ